MPSSSTSPEPSPVLLHAACEQCVACLRDLVGIHFEIDPPTNVIASDGPHCVHGLRKVLIHVNATIGWKLDVNVMHVIAPELRAASEQIDGFWDEACRAMELEDPNGLVGAGTRGARAFAKARQELVSAFVHPTPQRLFLPREQGGLAPASDSRYYFTLLGLLFDLAFRYAISIAYLSQLLRAGKEQAITSVMHKIQSAFAAVSLGNSSTTS